MAFHIANGSRSKYRAIPTFVDNIRFASKREAECYQQLKWREKAGEITELECQPRYPLHSTNLETGEVTRIAYYVADFRYQDRCLGLVVEDAKGMKTPVYRLKKKLFEAEYGLLIHEV